MSLDGRVLSGRILAEKRMDRFKGQVVQLHQKLKRPPSLTVVLVGEDPASQVYVGHKQKQCEKAGIHSQVVKLSQSITEAELRAKLNKLNQDGTVDGVLVQLPLPSHLKGFDPSDNITPEKDVDGLTATNMGLMIKGRAFAEPCTPKGIVALLKENGVTLAGTKSAVVGRSQIVGWPMAWMLTREQSTVTVCHSQTQNLNQILADMDIVVVAAGRPHFLNKTHFKKGAVVVDVGIHRKDKKLIGDVCTEGFEEAGVSFTPVPGGVGPMTVSVLLENVIELAGRKAK